MEYRNYVIKYERNNEALGESYSDGYIFFISTHNARFQYHFSTKKEFSNTNHFVDLCMMETMHQIKKGHLRNLYRDYTTNGEWINKTETGRRA